MIKQIFVILGVVIIMVASKFFWWEALGVLSIIGALIAPSKKRTFVRMKR